MKIRILLGFSDLLMPEVAAGGTKIYRVLMVRM
jgi:hypothetical protein